MWPPGTPPGAAHHNMMLYCGFLQEGVWLWSDGRTMTYTAWYKNRPTSSKSYNCVYTNCGKTQVTFSSIHTFTLFRLCLYLLQQIMIMNRRKKKKRKKKSCSGSVLLFVWLPNSTGNSWHLFPVVYFVIQWILINFNNPGVCVCVTGKHLWDDVACKIGLPSVCKKPADALTTIT